MTKEETIEKAIENLKILKEDYWDDDGYGHETKQYDDTIFALDMAIKALELEQEPCDDAISRQAVDTLVDELARAISDERCCISRGRSTATIIRDIYHLPSVNPQAKTGHWIRQTDDYHDYYECEYCGIAVGFDDIKNYCPKCGARMVDPQESEETNADSD